MWPFRKKTPVSNESPDASAEEKNKPIDERPWIGVDLDGTLAFCEEWKGFKKIGKPIPGMYERVKSWTDAGLRVKIMTARASVPEEGIPPVKKWLAKHGFPDLEVTCKKDFYMIELWDDRAIQVLANVGKPVISTSVLSHPKSEHMLARAKAKAEKAAQKNS